MSKQEIANKFIRYRIEYAGRYRKPYFAVWRLKEMEEDRMKIPTGRFRTESGEFRPEMKQ